MTTFETTTAMRPRSRADATTTARPASVAERREQLDTERFGEGALGVVEVVVDDHHVMAATGQRANGRGAGHRESVHE